MSVIPNAEIVITALSRVPDVAQGYVRDMRPRWACEEIGLAYSERLIDWENKPANYYREQPWGQVPVITDRGVEVFESGAILLHLAEKDERLLPSDPQRKARAISWLFAALNTIEPWVFELLFVDVFAKDEEWAKLRRPSLHEFLDTRLDRLADALGDKDYLDDKFSVGDLGMATVLRDVKHIAQHEPVSSRPKLAAYLDRCLARPAFKRALDAQLTAFRRHQQKGNAS